MRLSRHQWFALAGVWLIILSGNWAADGLKALAVALLAGQRVGWSVAAGPGLLLLVLVLSSLWVYHHRAAFGGVYGLSRQLCPPHESVVLLVSRSSMPLPATGSFPITLQSRDVTIRLDGKSLREDIDVLNKLPSNGRWNWQQLLRAMSPHVVGSRGKKPRRVRLIGSPGTAGSFEQLPVCASILQSYLPDTKILKADRAVEFEDFNELVDLIRLVIKEERSAGIKAKDIVVDVTGGQKTASIAAAAVTLNNAVTFQYVQTSPPYDVYSYDVVWQSPISLEE